MTSRSRVQRLFGGLALSTAVALAGVAPVTAADGYKADVARRADFVAQTNFVQCVGASLQMMINMIEPGRDRSAKEQLRLQKRARKLSPPRRDGSLRQGASVRGWVTSSVPRARRSRTLANRPDASPGVASSAPRPATSTTESNRRRRGQGQRSSAPGRCGGLATRVSAAK